MITIANVRFFSSLPAPTPTRIASSHETTDPTLARFVEVTVTPQTLNTIFPASFLGGSNTSTTGARAVAGFQSVVCQIMPMFICNPYEGTGTTHFRRMADPALRRRQIKMQLGTGGTSQYFPGNYGWLNLPIFGNGATALRDALALVNPPTCFEQNGVSQKTGNIESANDAINVRFDLWRGPYNNKNKACAYRPARNVRKGYAPGKGNNGACNPNDNPSDPNPNTARLGRDSAYPYSGGRMGNGDGTLKPTGPRTSPVPPRPTAGRTPTGLHATRFTNTSSARSAAAVPTGRQAVAGAIQREGRAGLLQWRRLERRARSPSVVWGDYQLSGPQRAGQQRRSAAGARVREVLHHRACS